MENETYLAEYEIIMAAADKQGIPLRLVGAISVILHCPKYAKIHQDLNREVTDIDFISYGKYNADIPKLFERLGYEPEVRHMAYYGKNRHIYNHPKNGVVVDVFFDKLEMSHTIDFRGRLELDHPTIPLSNIVLTKTQIVQINEKDLKDLCIIFLEHELGQNDSDKIDEKYIAQLLAKDWGFYHTVEGNLKKVDNVLESFDALTDDDRYIIKQRVDQLSKMIEAEPKSLAWKLRSRIGEKVKWYNDIEERVR